ncbi:MAG: DNA recombination protein RmuC [Candidatus Nomurabacteria bacterium]|jgi:DNA recombination protein RmuC|nr:DNA recombination protein RmuC [Candidatus Nomurabacteria bacterium]
MEIVLVILVVALILGFAFAVVMMNKQIGQLSETMNEKLDKNNVQVQESIGKQLTESNRQLNESNKVVADISARIATINETNKHVVSVADELKTLQNVLQNPKQRGVFGEFYLDSVLGNVLPPNTYQLQYKFKDGEIVDAAIFLDKGKILPVDSKFSLENYNRMLNAKDKSERDIYVKKIREDLKGRIDETAKYIRPGEKTMDFAFMFIPSESLYYDLLIGTVGSSGSSQRDLIEYAFRDKRVIVTSPTSFMAYLQTVLQGLRSLQIEKETLEIQTRVAKLGTHLNSFETYMNKMGSALGTTVNHYNSAHKSLVQIDKDVVKITTSGEPTIEPKQLDRPQTDE